MYRQQFERTMSTGKLIILYLVHFSLLFYLSDIDVFSCQRPVTKLGQNGVEETWIIKTYFTTEETFPTVLRRSEVVAIETVDISPIESALNDLDSKTRELSTMNVRYSTLAKTGQSVPTNALSMALNGVVDAPVHGGVALYRQAFLSPEYIAQNPDRMDLVQRLRNAIDDQVRWIPLADSREFVLMHKSAGASH